MKNLLGEELGGEKGDASVAWRFFQQMGGGQSHRQVARNLGLHPNTVARWAETKRVPADYARDLGRLAGNAVALDTPRQNGQFFTKHSAAQKCIAVMHRVLRELDIDERDYAFVEPAAGCGRFYDLLPQNRRKGLDIDPKRPGIECADYLTWRPKTEEKIIVAGNPPFGLRGHLALQFVNHSAAFADAVAFVLPPLFDSDGKGAAGKRVRGLSLAHSEKLPADSFEYPNGKAVSVATVFQVWTRINRGKIRRPPPRSCASFARVYSLSDGGTPSSTRNKAMLDKCDVYLPSTCFSGMRAYSCFADLPHRRGYGVLIRNRRHKQAIAKLLREHDWTKTAFASTNSALNLRRSLIEQVVIDGGYEDA